MRIFHRAVLFFIFIRILLYACTIFMLIASLFVDRKKSNLSSNELIGYIDLSDFYEIWPK